jgi:hypothetical protein
MYQNRLLDLEKTVQEEDERQNNVFNFEAQYENILEENLEIAKKNRIDYGMDDENAAPEMKQLKEELEMKRSDRIRSEATLMNTIIEKEDELMNVEKDIKDLKIDSIIQILKSKDKRSDVD